MSKILICQTQAPTAAAAAFTAAATTVIDAAMVHNPTGATDTLSVWIVPTGGSASDANAAYTDLSVSSGETISLSPLVNQVIPKDAELHLMAGTSATALTVTVAGRE